MVRALNRLSRGPVTGRPFDFAAVLGDSSDNQQRNEVRWFVDLMDGGRLVRPDSGAPGYEGVQGEDPYPSPVEGESLLYLAQKPFWAPGLRRPDGSPLPWYSVLGNHDVKVQGTVPGDNPAWQSFAKAWVVGSVKVASLPP